MTESTSTSSSLSSSITDVTSLSQDTQPSQALGPQRQGSGDSSDYDQLAKIRTSMTCYRQQLIRYMEQVGEKIREAEQVERYDWDILRKIAGGMQRRLKNTNHLHRYLLLEGDLDVDDILSYERFCDNVAMSIKRANDAITKGTPKMVRFQECAP